MKRIFAAGALALTVMLGSNAKAEDLKVGVSYSVTQENGPAMTITLHDLKDGVAYVQFADGKWLAAESAEEGARVMPVNTKEKATKWKLHKNSNGWNFLHVDNGANAVSSSIGPKGDGKKTNTLKLRRNNAGGNGNKDQLWQFKAAPSR